MSESLDKSVMEMPGGICTPAGYAAAGVACGMKSDSGPSAGKDLAILFSQSPAHCAAVFTANMVKAWPVLLCRKHLASGKAQAVVVNTGSANCLTGKQGKKDADEMARLTAQALSIRTTDTMVCSTGLIGAPLTMGKIRAGIARAARSASPEGDLDAALAITTTDTYPKQAAVKIYFGDKAAFIGGMAKGAGMISPRLATMLVFITTDVALPGATLQKCLKKAVGQSFNKITVDGETSTNDTVLLFANGASGVAPRGRALRIFQAGLDLVCEKLAKMIVEDGEGATKFITVTLKGASSAAQADRVARAIANSQLVKTALHGEDPNWGRILSAAGASGAKFDAAKIDLSIAGIQVIKRGEPTKYSAAEAHKALGARDIEVCLDLHAGRYADTIYTCDLSEEYVTFNADYHT